MAATTSLRQLPTHERRLRNGLTVIVREDHSAPVVAVVTHVKAGYFDEPDTLIGISHVLEHMYFKGTVRRGPGEIARETKDAGGYLNAVRLLQEARKHGMMAMLGCMVETSLGIWSAMQLSSAFDFADLDGFLIVENEPFQLVREQDGILYLK